MFAMIGTITGTPERNYYSTVVEVSRKSCTPRPTIHYANSLHGKLCNEMEGRFNQELLDNLWTAFENAINFEPRVLTEQKINTRRVNEVNHIDVSSDQEFEVNEAHVRNPNYKGKNYDHNYQKNKHNSNSKTNNSNLSILISSSGYKGNNNSSGGNFNNAKNDYTEKPANIQSHPHWAHQQRSAVQDPGDPEKS